MPNYFLVNPETNAVEGTSDTEVDVLNLKCLEGPFAAPWDVYSDGEKIFLKPPKPSDTAFWSEDQKEWIEPLEDNTPAPKYLEFRVGMLRDPAYDRITLASNVLRVTRLETAVSQNPPELPIVMAMWGVLIDELTEKPTAADVKRWNAIASSNHIPVKFDKSGKMVQS